VQLAVKYKELSASFSIAGSKMMGFSSSTPPEPSYLNSVSSSNGKVRIFALCLLQHTHLLCIEHGLEHKPSEFKTVLVTRKRAEELPCNFWNP
jgi:hypothetical protein